MEKSILLAAVNRDQLNEALGKAENSSMVAFATLDDKILARLKQNLEQAAQEEVSVYFYETG